MEGREAKEDMDRKEESEVKPQSFHSRGTCLTRPWLIANHRPSEQDAYMY